MKSLYLFRHGEAENRYDSDYLRELTENGRTRTALMAETLKSAGCVIDHIISSGAPRAKATADAIAEVLDFPLRNIETDDVIYNAGYDKDLLPLIWNTRNDFSSLLIVGHNPVLSDLVSYLTIDGTVVDMSRSSAVKVEFDSQSWSSVTPYSGRSIFYRKIINGEVRDFKFMK